MSIMPQDSDRKTTQPHEFCCGAGEQFVQQAGEVLWEYSHTDTDPDDATAMLDALLPLVLAYGDARAAEATTRRVIDELMAVAHALRDTDGAYDFPTDRAGQLDGEYAASWFPGRGGVPVQ